MKRLSIPPALIGFLALLSLGDLLPAAERVALVVGNNAYTHARPLETALNDAAAVADRLERLNFEVDLVRDANLEQMVVALERLKEKASGADAVLVYYAGHGIESEGTNYLIPVDARLEREIQLKTQTLSLEMLLREMKTISVPARMVILDCCRDNPLEGRSWLATRSSGGGGLAALAQDSLAEATLVVFSASPGKPALDLLDSKDSHSPFTDALLGEMLRPGVHSFEMFGRIEESVLQKTSGRQAPRLFYNGSTLPFRNFAFASSSNPPTLPPMTRIQETATQPSGAASSPSLPASGSSFTNSIGIEMVWVAPLSCWVGKYEVTQSEYSRVVGSNPSTFRSDRLPVQNVSWRSALDFCSRLSAVERESGRLPSGKVYTLPSDSDWSVFVGDASTRHSVLGVSAGYTRPQPVGSLSPNQYGLYDVRGNVWEWLMDRYDPAMNSASVRSQLRGISSVGRVVRGASYSSSSQLMTAVGTRASDREDERDKTVGFRVILKRP